MSITSIVIVTLISTSFSAFFLIGVETRRKEAARRSREARERQRALDHELNIGRRIFNFLSMTVNRFDNSNIVMSRVEENEGRSHYFIMVEQIDIDPWPGHLPILRIYVYVADEFHPYIMIQHGTCGHVDLFDITEEGIRKALETATEALVEFEKDHRPV